MRDTLIYPSTPKGEITPPPSKSMAHRAIICAAVSKGDCLIANFAPSDDVTATIDGMKAMGSRIEAIENKLFITQCVRNLSADINCHESGSTMRFLIPLAAALGVNASFTGEGRLPERTIDIYEQTLADKGVWIKTNGGFLPVEIRGKMSGGVFKMPGNVSSQFISGMLMAAPITEERVEIVLTSELESSPYVDLTISVMENYGIKVIRTETGFIVEEGQQYVNGDIVLEGDYSQAAFWMVMNELGADILVKGLSENSRQGDKKIAEIIAYLKEPGDKTVDAANIPDLVPVIAVLAGVREGTTDIINAERLKLKESDRLKSTSELINSIGGNAEILENGLKIIGVSSYNGGSVNTYCDHRIAMAAAVASVKCLEPIRLNDSDCVRKSYPEFFNEFVRLGGKVKR